MDSRELFLKPPRRLFAMAALPGMVSMLASSLAGAAVVVFAPQPIAAVFMSDASPDELALAYVTRWVTFAVQSYFLAIGKPLPASVVPVCM